MIHTPVYFYDRETQGNIQGVQMTSPLVVLLHPPQRAVGPRAAERGQPVADPLPGVVVRVAWAWTFIYRYYHNALYTWYG